MTATTTLAPAVLRSGDSATLTAVDAVHRADDGWSLTLLLLSAAQQYSIAGAASGADHVLALTTADTAGYAAGAYHAFAQYDHTDGRRETVPAGPFTIEPDVATLAGYDARSHAEKMLDAIEAALEGRATSDQLDLMSAGGLGRNLARDPEKLIRFRNQYQNLVARERAGSGTARGRVLVRF